MGLAKALYNFTRSASGTEALPGATPVPIKVVASESYGKVYPRELYERKYSIDAMENDPYIIENSIFLRNIGDATTGSMFWLITKKTYEVVEGMCIITPRKTVLDYSYSEYGCEEVEEEMDFFSDEYIQEFREREKKKRDKREEKKEYLVNGSLHDSHLQVPKKRYSCFKRNGK